MRAPHASRAHFAARSYQPLFAYRSSMALTARMSVDSTASFMWLAAQL